MKDKMVLSCLKLKQNSLKHLKRPCSHSQQKRSKCLGQFEKMNSGKIVKQKEEIVSTKKILYWYWLYSKINSEIMARLNIYHLFATALVSIRSRRWKREKNKKRRGSGFWIRPLFADRATSGAYQSLVLEIKEIDR